MHTRPVWVEISRRKLVSNYVELGRATQELLAPEVPGQETTLLAVVKANAYGHGMRDCARLLAGAGAQWIGVTSVEEGVEARAACPGAHVLVMSGLWHGEADAVIDHRLTSFVWQRAHLDLLEAAAQRSALAPQSLPVHLEIDTGMSRQGVQWKENALVPLLQQFHPQSPLRLDGVATHFSAPEELDSSETDQQRLRFEGAINRILSHGHRPRWIHAGNSTTLLRGEQLGPLRQAASAIGARLMLRPGLSLYGYAPRLCNAGETMPYPGDLAAKLSPVLAWKTRVTSIRNIEAGESAGYNSTFRATRSTQLALLPMGYADGLNRLLSNRGSVLIRGSRMPIAGRVSMDQTIVDITGHPEVRIGDEVVVLGTQATEAITACDLADLTHTIPYEVLCAIASRVPRVLVD